MPPNRGDTRKNHMQDQAVTLTVVSEVQPEHVTWLWPGRIPVGKLVTLDGDPGVGKSTLALAIAATITTGGEWPDGTRCPEAGNVLTMNAEDGIADTVRPRLDAAGADTDRVAVIGGDASITLADTGKLRELITEFSARLLVVDVMMAFLPGAANSYRDQDMRAVLTPLASLAGETGCTILLLRHPPKGQQTKAIHAGGGSIGIIGAARVGLLAVSTDSDTRVLSVTKNNLAPIPPSLAYRLVTEDVNGIAAARVEWMGEYDASADELVTGEPVRFGERTGEVLAFAKDRDSTTPGDVSGHLGIDAKRASEILARLADRGQLVKVSRGVYSAGVRTPGIAESAESAGRNGISIPQSIPQCGNEFRTDSASAENETAPEQALPQIPHFPTHTPPDPGHDPMGRPEGSATLGDVGSGRTCKIGCPDPVYCKGFCEVCFHLDQADTLVRGVAERSKSGRYN